MFNKISKWLEKIAEKNESLYGNRKPDCCGLNRQNAQFKKKRVASRNVPFMSQEGKSVSIEN